jgi:hypothetical protein
MGEMTNINARSPNSITVRSTRRLTTNWIMGPLPGRAGGPAYLAAMASG